MHVALVVHARLPVAGYGGTERVVPWLARGLAELGHEVTVVAAHGSRLPEARVVGMDRAALEDRALDVARALPPGVDIVHAHRQLHVAPPVPAVWTLHGNARPGTPLPDNTIFLSANHARRHGREAFVYNGLDPREYDFRAAKDDYDLFLGRLHGVKGWRWAVEGARRAGRRLVVAGGWRPSLRRGLRFAGTVDGARKRALLAGAGCLWMPALWEEPFGLVLIEAMASGTPVLGTRRGALPEVVSPDTGALGDTLDELVALREAIGRRDPAACRARVESHFSHVRMAEGYVRQYRHWLAHGTLLPGIVAGAPAAPAA